MMVLGKEGFEERRDLGSEFGTALICGLDGVVIQVLKADPGLVPIDPGDRLASWIDADCQDKLTSFFHSLQAAPQPGIWELILRDQDTVKPVFAAGLFSQELFLITLAGERSSSFQLLRSLSEELKEFAGINLPEDPRFLGRGSSEVDFFEELTRVNNQLISSQRLIQAQKAELAELNRLKDRFLGMAAHDLRNPLAAIMSYAEFLTDDLEGLISPEQEEFLSIIRSSSNFMLDLIEDLLDVSVISLGGMTINKQPVDLAELIEGAVSLNAALAANKQIWIEFLPLEGGPWQGIYDPTKISQLLNNLISNAIKFSSPGDLVQVGLEKNGQEFEIRVRDQGPGIPEDQLQRLFQPFGTTTVQATGGEKSTGLGLAISKAITEAHGGQISVETSSQSGTIFRVILPINHEAVD